MNKKLLSSGASTYSYSDYNVFSGSDTYYYRLKTIDNDGSFTYSGTIVVNNSLSTTQIKVYPNPFAEYITIESPSKNALITIISSNGQVIKSINTTESKTLVNVQELTKGSYIIKMVGAQGTLNAAIIKN